MVPADSRRIPRAPRYSGYHYASDGFVYRVITVSDWAFQPIPLAVCHAMPWSYNPIPAVTGMVWAIPRSLATTWGIIVYFLFLLLLRCFSSQRLPPLLRMTGLQPDGLSHSESPGSRVICTYPGLIAAYHVLHRLREPRHPPCALACLLSYRSRTVDIYFQL